MSNRLAHATATAGVLYATALVLNVVATTDGPRPDAPQAQEAARVLAESTELRWSALLGLLSALAFGMFAIGLAVLLARAQRPAAAGLVAAAGTSTSGVWAVSFAALAAAAQAAQTGARADVVLALGHLHSTTLVLSFAAMSGVLFGAVVGGFVASRTGRTATLLVAGAGVASAALVLDVRLDTGPLGGVIVLPFLGLPIWVLAMSLRLARGSRPAQLTRTSRVP